MSNYIHLLPDLENILHSIYPIQGEHYFNDDDSIEIYTTCLHLMEELVEKYPKLITEPDFEDIFDENINELMRCHFDSDIFYNDDSEDELENIIECAKNDFYKHIYPIRSWPNTCILQDPDYEFVEEQLNILRSKVQPAQRTKEWYEFRRNLITASNAYKAFENENVKNQLIYEKCQQQSIPNHIVDDDNIVEHETIQMVNVNSTLHWGQKYEPLSVNFYEYLFDTKIEDFGCIQHEKYKFLGASPDGINVEPTSKRYGRMLEIKNIVNREIDGIPKKEYWIQMQLQMEVCDLDECDFLETRFTEYNNWTEFLEDIDNNKQSDNICLSKEENYKGIIVYFHTKEGKPFYVYKPLSIVFKNDIELWEEEILDKYQGTEYNYTFMKFIYWKLSEYSCVLVQRNRQWFQSNVVELEELWKIVEKERETGYEHRAPNKRKKDGDKNIDNINLDIGTNCLLKFIKPKINVVKIDEPLELDLDLGSDIDLDTINI